jgi:hypothetical protein
MAGLVGVVVLPGQAQETDPADIGVDTAQQNLQTISVSRFEDPGFWRSSIPADRGLVIHRRLAGSPADKEPIPAEQEAGIEPTDENVVGLRANFYRRGDVAVSLVPVRPLAVPGIVKTLSVWVVGRNFNHRLSVVVEDYFGNINVLPMGTLNFSGWSQMTVAIPPSIEQRSPHYNTETGLLIRGFVIDAELTEAFGTFYVYFDGLRAVTDLFAEQARDDDDLIDNW